MEKNIKVCGEESPGVAKLLGPSPKQVSVRRGEQR